MDIKYVAARVDSIRQIQKNPEVAHAQEDALHRDVLQEIVLGHPDPVALAQAALETRNIKFPRWCG